LIFVEDEFDIFYNLELLTTVTVVTQTEHVALLSFYITSIVSLLCIGITFLTRQASVKAYFLNLIYGTSLMDISNDEYNCANLNDLQNIRNNVQSE
jgi:hypothetical protein